MADYYETLGVSPDASAEEIRRAFRRIARESHPDVNPDDPSAEARFRAAAEAYEVLSDPKRRAAYDRGDTIDLGDLFSSFAGVEDLLARFFGGGFGPFAGTRQGPAPGRDVAVAMSVSLAEAAAGVEREVRFETPVSCPTCAGSGSAPGVDLAVCPRCDGQGSLRVARQTLLGTAMTIAPCDTCRGRGRVIVEACEACSGAGAVRDEVVVPVEVPPGIEDGTRIRVPGRGSAGDAGSRSGDLFVEVRVEPDDRFTRHGADLVHRVRLGLAEATLGTEVRVPTVEDGEVQITIPAGTQPGTVFKLSRKGMPRMSRRGRGDLLVEVVLDVPTSLTPEQEKALRAYAEAVGEDPQEPKRRRR